MNVKLRSSWPLALVLVKVEESVGMSLNRRPAFPQQRTTGVEANTKIVLFMLNGCLKCQRTCSLYVNGHIVLTLARLPPWPREKSP